VSTAKRKIFDELDRRDVRKPRCRTCNKPLSGAERHRRRYRGLCFACTRGLDYL
jgi:ribosomal protein L34E